MTPEQIGQLAFSVKDEMGADGITAEEVADAVRDGTAIFEQRAYGFALVTLSASPRGDGHIPHLWLFYVAPEHRGQGNGLRFLRELLRKHASLYHMSLGCSGARRRRFFGKAGFVIESRHGDYRHMTTNRDFYR